MTKGNDESKNGIKEKARQEETREVIKDLKQQLNSFENKEMVWALKRLQEKTFEGANKPGKFFAQQLKRKKEKKVN